MFCLLHNRFFFSDIQFIDVKMKKLKLSLTTITEDGKTVTEPLPLVSPHFKPTSGESHGPSHTQQEQAVDFHVNTQNAFLDVGDLQAGRLRTGNPWKEVRAKLREAYYTSRVPQIPVGCSECGVMLENNFVKCEDCGPREYFCFRCCMKIHDGKMCQRNLFHKPKQWKVSF